MLLYQASLYRSLYLVDFLLLSLTLLSSVLEAISGRPQLTFSISLTNDQACSCNSRSYLACISTNLCALFVNRLQCSTSASRSGRALLCLETRLLTCARFSSTLVYDWARSAKQVPDRKNCSSGWSSPHHSRHRASCRLTWPKSFWLDPV